MDQVHKLVADSKEPLQYSQIIEALHKKFPTLKNKLKNSNTSIWDFISQDFDIVQHPKHRLTHLVKPKKGSVKQKSVIPKPDKYEEPNRVAAYIQKQVAHKKEIKLDKLLNVADPVDFILKVIQHM